MADANQRLPYWKLLPELVSYAVHLKGVTEQDLLVKRSSWKHARRSKVVADKLLTPDRATPFPEPGIYFGMPEETYHSIFACSSSGLKHMSVSSMNAWAMSLLNPERSEPDERSDGKLTPMQLGQAYHAYIVEGSHAFNKRYAIALDKDECAARAKADGRVFCVTIADIRKAIDDAGGKPKGTKKDDLIEQLMDLVPDAWVWDDLVAKHMAGNAGKLMISHVLHRRILIADRMIKSDPQLKDAFSGGHPEVSIFWIDKTTGVPCKARLDYIKMMFLIDLKSFGNKQSKPIQRAIDMAISYEKYYLQAAFYLEAIRAAKEMIKATKGECAKVFKEGELFLPDDKLREWVWRWAHQEQPEVIYIFQQSGVAPVTRGRKMLDGGTMEISRIAMAMLMKKWKRCLDAYGSDPWIDYEPVRATVDEELTWAATDFGDMDDD